MGHALVQLGPEVACHWFAARIFVVLILFEILISFGWEIPVQRHGTIAFYGLRQENTS